MDGALKTDVTINGHDGNQPRRSECCLH